MKKAFLLLCALLLALGSALPLAGYRLARAVLGRRADVPPVPASSTSTVSEAAPAAFEGDADVFLIEDLSTGEVQQVPKQDYLIGAAAAEMPLTWPDEALKAQIVAAHSYALYCRDHASAANGSWLSADPARRQGYLTDAVLHSYWGPTTRPTMPVSRPSRTPSSATSSAMAVRRQGRAILPSPMAVPRPARTSGAAHSPTSSRWTAAPTSPPTTTKSLSPFLPRRCSSFFPQGWASLLTLPRRNAGSVRRP